jgi:hypothetical protein
MVEFAEELREFLSHESLIVLFSRCGFAGEKTGYGEFRSSPESYEFFDSLVSLIPLSEFVFFIEALNM